MLDFSLEGEVSQGYRKSLLGLKGCGHHEVRVPSPFHPRHGLVTPHSATTPSICSVCLENRIQHDSKWQAGVLGQWPRTRMDLMSERTHYVHRLLGHWVKPPQGELCVPRLLCLCQEATQPGSEQKGVNDD